MGFSDLVDLWVIKIKKSMILCARSTWRSSEQAKRIENASAKRIMQREREKFVYSLVKITRLTMIIKHGGHIHEVRKDMWAFFLIVLYGC